MNEMQLFDVSGKRLYLTPEERNRFAQFASTHAKTNEARTFCRTIYYTGCRPSEALALTNNQIDFADQGIVIRSLKKRANKESGEPNIKHRFINFGITGDHIAGDLSLKLSRVFIIHRDRRIIDRQHND